MWPAMSPGCIISGLTSFGIISFLGIVIFLRFFSIEHFTLTPSLKFPIQVNHGEKRQLTNRQVHWINVPHRISNSVYFKPIRSPPIELIFIIL